MVQKKKFLVFAIATVAIASYALYEKGVSSRAKKDPLSEYFSVTNWDFEKTESISMKNNDAEILIIREKGQWELVKPLKDIANKSKVRTFVQELFVSSLKKVDKGENEWVDYGFIEGQNLLEIKLKDENLLFHISPQLAFDGHTYVKINERLYLGSGHWIKIFHKSKSHFRDQTVNRFWSDPVKVEFKSEKNESFKLVKKQESWAFLDGTKASSEKMKALMNGLLFLTAKQSAEETQENASMYGLDKPSFELLLTDKNNKEHTIKFSIKENRAFVMTSQRKPIFEVLASTVGRWNYSKKDLAEDIEND